MIRLRLDGALFLRAFLGSPAASATPSAAASSASTATGEVKVFPK